MSLLIKNCRLILRKEDERDKEDKEVIRNIYIGDGRIKSITIRSPKADKAYDAEGNFVIPGVIDPHVHFREPGLDYKEDFYTGSRAAAAGGITTVLDMPNTAPPVFTTAQLDEKRSLAMTRPMLVNYGFYMGTSRDNNVKEVRRSGSCNAAATKIFMNLSTGNLLVEDKSLLESYFRASNIIAVHAQGEKAAEAVHYAKKFRKRLYLCHITLKQEIDMLRKERLQGTKEIYSEVTPHHLFLTKDDYMTKKGFAKMIPPLASKQDQNSLWEGINDGIVSTIGTDHAPHTIEEKMRDDPPAGVPGVETMLPLMLNAVNQGKISLKKVVELTSRNPARIFGIRKKGEIKTGYDADLTIIDMDLEKQVRNEDLKSKCRWSPFNGWKLKGWPVATIVGGRIVYDHGKIYKNQGKEVVFRG